MLNAPLHFFDRTAARTALRGNTGSICGVAGTLVLVAVALWLLIPEIQYHLEGKYYQSSFQVQQPPYARLVLPRDFRAALVFRNKTSSRVANHTLLRQLATFKAYLTQNNSISQAESIEACQSGYFGDTVNPVELEDCFIFPNNREVDFSYYQHFSTSFGFLSGFDCQNPFFCKASDSLYNTTRSQYSKLFSDYFFTLYFTSRVITPQGTFQDQLFNISSAQWNTPFTVTAEAGVELELLNTTMDNSILPWWNNLTLTTPAFYGNVQGAELTSTKAYTAPPKAYFFNSQYQNLNFRYYQKLDSLLGVIGGCVFLLFLICFLPCHYINQSLFRTRAAHELLIEHALSSPTLAEEDSLKEVTVGNCYFWSRLLPWRQEEQVQQVRQVLDIALMVKMLKVSEKNMRLAEIQLYSKMRTLDFEREIGGGEAGTEERKDPQNESQGIILQPNQNGEVEEEVQTQLRKNNPAEIRAIYPHKSLLLFQQYMTEPQLASQETVFNSTLQQQSNKHNLHLEVLQALRSSSNSARLLSPNPTALKLCNSSPTLYHEAVDGLQYDRLCSPNGEGRGWMHRLVDCLASAVRCFDAFGVRPQFLLNPASASVCGCLVTLLILGLVVLFCILAVINVNNFHVMVSQDFHVPQDIDYTIQTGSGFRPFLCFALYSPVSSITSNSPTIELSFYTKTRTGIVKLQKTNLKSNQLGYLGITADSPYSTIRTENCFVMNDGQTLSMGGLGTSQEGYFGFKISAYCSGTEADCLSRAATLRTTILSFIRSFAMTLYMPINSYDPKTHSIYGGGHYPTIIREGLSSFVTTTAVEQTIYLDQIRKLDRLSQRYLGQALPVLEQSVTTDRYQQAPNVRAVTATVPYYEVRVRPSGKVTDVILVGTTSYEVLGMIGGLVVIFWGLLHCFGKCYNHYNVRAKLAHEMSFNDYYQTSSPLQKVWTIFRLPLLSCFPDHFRSEVRKMRVLDDKMKFDTQALEVVKEVNMVHQLSVARLETSEEKQCALIYFKETAVLDQFREGGVERVRREDEEGESDRQFIGDDHDEQNLSVPSNIPAVNNPSINRVRNELPVISEHRLPNHSTGNIQNRVVASLDEEILLAQGNIDTVQTYDLHRGPLGLSRSKWGSWLVYLDWFSTKPEFSLRGQWRVKSVFGGLLTFGLVACVLVMYVHSVAVFHEDRNQITSHEKMMETHPAQGVPFSLNGSNFRLGVGFYAKPNSLLVNISSFISSGVSINITQVSLTRGPDNLLSHSEVSRVLQPCASDYFDRFKDGNTDYSFLANLTYAFCLPTDLNFKLSSTSSNPIEYLRITVSNTSSLASSRAALRSLTSSLLVGLYMTVPVVDLQHRQFKYSVQQIRGNSNPLSRSFEFNLTISKQRVVFAATNYSVHPDSAQIETYNYLNNRDYERKVFSSVTSVPQHYNVSLSYQGLVDQYTVRQEHFATLFGVAGGIIALYFCLAVVVGESFNTFKMKFEVARELYLLERRSQDDNVLKRVPTDFNELQLFWAWLLSFPAGVTSSYTCSNTLMAVTTLINQVEPDLNLYTFFRKVRTLKDTINHEYKLSANHNILATSLFTKLPYVPSGQPYQLGSGAFQQYLQRHGLSSYEQNRLRQLFETEAKMEKVFENKTVQRHFDEYRREIRGVGSDQEPLKLERRSSEVEFVEQRELGRVVAEQTEVIEELGVRQELGRQVQEMVRQRQEAQSSEEQQEREEGRSGEEVILQALQGFEFKHNLLLQPSQLSQPSQPT